MRIRYQDRTAELCRLVMQTMLECVDRARPGSPLRRAYDGLGGAFPSVAGQILETHARTSLVGDPALHRADRTEVAAAIAAAIVADSVRDVILTWESVASC